jgi:hypothetical protein
MRVRRGGQINPSKSKLKQAKKLAFPWIPLAESGLFNGLQRIQNKKILSLSIPSSLSLGQNRIRSPAHSE